jgi:hypothetical protein
MKGDALAMAVRVVALIVSTLHPAKLIHRERNDIP